MAKTHQQPNHQHHVITVINQTRSCTLAEQCEVAASFWTRLLGLMGRSGLDSGQALLIYPEWSIHTFFMRFPIDVLFLDQHDRVIGMRTAMPPNLPFAGVWGAHAVIEFPANVLAPTATALGDQITLSPPPYGQRAKAS